MNKYLFSSPVKAHVLAYSVTMVSTSYRPSCPSVRRPFVNIFIFSETIGPIELRFHMKNPTWVFVCVCVGGGGGGESLIK